jgi:riboflavin kinase
MAKVEAGSIRGNLLLTLSRLAELSAPKREFTCTTGELAAQLGFSQQTASRHLIELERKGLIKRARVTKRESIRVTPQGLDLLSEMYSALRRVFEGPANEIYLEGELFSGMGEGIYYLSQGGYRRQLRERLGFEPYPGTLNLRLRPGYENEKRMLDTLPLLSITGFKSENRSFGPVKCAPAIVNESVRAGVVLALRSHYGPDVIELVSEENLRRRLRLKDGDTVRVKVITSAPR